VPARRLATTIVTLSVILLSGPGRLLAAMPAPPAAAAVEPLRFPAAWAGIWQISEETRDCAGGPVTFSRTYLDTICANAPYYGVSVPYGFGESCSGPGFTETTLNRKCSNAGSCGCLGTRICAQTDSVYWTRDGDVATTDFYTFHDETGCYPQAPSHTCSHTTGTMVRLSHDTPACPTYLLDVSVVGSGSVTKSPNLASYDYGTVVTLQAIPSAGWVFSGWSGDTSGVSNPLDIVMNAGKSVTATFGLEVGFDFKPHDLNLNSKGKWLTGYLRPQDPYFASQIDPSSIRLNGTVPVSADQPVKIEEHDTRLKVKFARSDVLPTLTAGDHVPVTVSGLIAGMEFAGTDTIKVKGPKVHEPRSGDQLEAGATTQITWDVGDGAESATLMMSQDDGVTWSIEQEGIPNTGSFNWTVPPTITSEARLGVMQIYEIDETGVVPQSEPLISDAFSIVSPLAVAGPGQEPFALSPVNPATGPLAVRFSLRGPDRAVLSVYDVSGRTVAMRNVGEMGRGWHTVSMGALPPGMYVLQLRQGGSSLTARAVVVR